MVQQKVIVEDYCLGLLSEWKLGASALCEFEINNLYLDSTIQAFKEMRGNDNVFKYALQMFEHILRAQIVPPLHQVNFDDYKKHRTVTIAGK
jgi:hypothetical protein